MKIKIGDKIVDVDRVENGVPVIRARAETIIHADGTQDVIVRVPCLQIQASKENN